MPLTFHWVVECTKELRLCGFAKRNVHLILMSHGQNVNQPFLLLKVWSLQQLQRNTVAKINNSNGISAEVGLDNKFKTGINDSYTTGVVGAYTSLES